MSAERPIVKAVFDCMVFLQAAARKESPSGACLLLGELGHIELCVSDEVSSEIQDVLMRPRVRQRFPALSDELIHRFLAALRTGTKFFPEVPRLFIYERDPKDEPYINLAIAAGASYLVSRDSDILSLREADNPDGLRLRSFAPELKILDPVSFLADLRRTRGSGKIDH